MAANTIHDYAATVAVAHPFNYETDAFGRQGFLTFAVYTVCGYRNSARENHVVFGFHILACGFLGLHTPCTVMSL